MVNLLFLILFNKHSSEQCVAISLSNIFLHCWHFFTRDYYLAIDKTSMLISYFDNHNSQSDSQSEQNITERKNNRKSPKI